MRGISQSVGRSVSGKNEEKTGGTPTIDANNKRTAQARPFFSKAQVLGTNSPSAVSLLFPRSRGFRRRPAAGRRLRGRFSRSAARRRRRHARLCVVSLDHRFRDVDGRPIPDHRSARPGLRGVDDHSVTVVAGKLHDERRHLGQDLIADLALLILVVLLRILLSSAQSSSAWSRSALPACLWLRRSACPAGR